MEIDSVSDIEILSENTATKDLPMKEDLNLQQANEGKHKETIVENRSNMPKEDSKEIQNPGIEKTNKSQNAPTAEVDEIKDITTADMDENEDLTSENTGDNADLPPEDTGEIAVAVREEDRDMHTADDLMNGTPVDMGEIIKDSLTFTPTEAIEEHKDMPKETVQDETAANKEENQDKPAENTEENTVMSTEVTDMEENPKMSTEDTHMDENPKGTDMEENPEMPTEIADMEENPQMSTEVTDMEENQEMSTEDTDMDRNPEMPTEGTDKEENQEIPTEIADMEENPEMSTEVTYMEENPEMSTEDPDKIKDTAGEERGGNKENFCGVSNTEVCDNSNSFIENDDKIETHNEQETVSSLISVELGDNESKGSISKPYDISSSTLLSDFELSAGQGAVIDMIEQESSVGVMKETEVEELFPDLESVKCANESTLLSGLNKQDKKNEIEVENSSNDVQSKNNLGFDLGLGLNSQNDIAVEDFLHKNKIADNVKDKGETDDILAKLAEETEAQGYSTAGEQKIVSTDSGESSNSESQNTPSQENPLQQQTGHGDVTNEQNNASKSSIDYDVGEQEHRTESSGQRDESRSPRDTRTNFERDEHYYRHSDNHHRDQSRRSYDGQNKGFYRQHDRHERRDHYDSHSRHR